MVGGFNLSLINFFNFVPGREWRRWPLFVEGLLGSTIGSIIAVTVIIFVLFVVLNLIKIIFITTAHRFIHVANFSDVSESLKCNLCVKLKTQTEKQQTLPYLSWLLKVMLASGLTILATAGVTLAANTVLSSIGYSSQVAIIVNLLLIAAVTCILGTWNVFTGYFIVLHGMTFATASGAAIELLLKHSRRVIEFVIILSALYSFSVLVGGSLLNLWNSELAFQLNPIIRWILLLIPLLWLAVNNTFFNLAFLIFFDHTVKATPATEVLLSHPVTQSQ